MKTSLLLGFRYSSLSIRAMDFLAPNFFAITADRILVFSSGDTAIKRSHCLISHFSSTSNDVISPSMASTSAVAVSSSRRLALSSTAVISWYSCESMVARWLPTSPAPAIIIFIILALKCVQNYNFVL